MATIPTKVEVRRLISELGGPARAARLIGTGLTTVVYWNKVGRIPYWWWDKVASVTREQGKAPPAVMERRAA